MHRLYDSVIITGMKHCGKSSTAGILSGRVSGRFTDLDDEAEKLYFSDHAEKLSSREIYRKGGRELFRLYEKKAAESITVSAETHPLVAAAGGGICDNDEAVEILKTGFIFIYIHEEAEILYERIIRGGIPPFLSDKDPFADFLSIYKTRTAKYDNICDIRIDAAGRNPVAVADEALRKLLEDNYAG